MTNPLGRRRLGVRYVVLEGSVRKASGKVRIAGQLIDANTGAHIWADRFERDLTDIFALQEEVTVAVVSAIQPKLLQTEIAMATRRRPENLTAYDFYLRTMPHYYLTTREGVAEAIRLAHRAWPPNAATRGHFAVHAPVGWGRRAAIVLRQKWRRSQFETRLANMPPCLIGMEAWVGARRPWIVPRATDQGHEGRALKGDIN